jgi:hypothetical protein
VLLLGCSDAPGLSPEGAQLCVVDSIEELHATATLPDCTPDDLVCRVACLVGNTGYCQARAQAIQIADPTDGESIRLYHRSCVLGLAIGCTNYAASIWARDHTDAELSCALRTFEAACAASEPFACGMVGRVLLDEADSSSRVSDAKRRLGDHLRPTRRILVPRPG